MSTAWSGVGPTIPADPRRQIGVIPSVTAMTSHLNPLCSSADGGSGNKVSEPSQGKAQFLVAKAPIRNFQPEGIVPLRPDGGEPSKIGDQWRRYFQVAHYWAAFVVWTKSPLICPTDRFALIDFVARAEPG